jgi:quinolinate synthase
MSIDRCELCEQTFDTDFVSVEEHLANCYAMKPKEVQELLRTLENIYGYLIRLPELSKEENELLTEVEEVLRKYIDPTYGDSKPF